MDSMGILLQPLCCMYISCNADACPPLAEGTTSLAEGADYGNGVSDGLMEDHPRSQDVVDNHGYSKSPK